MADLLIFSPPLTFDIASYKTGSLAFWSTRPTHNHYFRSCCLYVRPYVRRHFSKSIQTKELPSDMDCGSLGLAEWIIAFITKTRILVLLLYPIYRSAISKIGTGFVISLSGKDIKIIAKNDRKLQLSSILLFLLWSTSIKVPEMWIPIIWILNSQISHCRRLKWLSQPKSNNEPFSSRDKNVV